MIKLTSDSLRQWTNFILIISAFLANILANIAPLNGLNIGEISNTFFTNVLIIPASSAFIIWGVIYLGLISLAIYQLLPSNSQSMGYLGYFLPLASLAQIIWLVCFQLRWFILSILPMLMILSALIVLYLRLPPKSGKTYWLVHQPISIYLGWISVATIVNIASALDYNNWDGWGLTSSVWTVIMMAVGSLLGACACWEKSDFAYPGVIIWALFWIGVANQSSSFIVACAGILAFALVIVMLLCKGKGVKGKG